MILDEKLNWKKHIEYIKSKVIKRLGVFKLLCKKNKLNQRIALILYKSMIRSCLNYNAEIRGDAANTYLRKLESIEQLAIAAALGVNRIANRRELNLEAKILPLKTHWKRKTMRTYCKLIDTEMEEYMKNNKRMRLHESERK